MSGNVGFAISIKKCDVVVKKEINEEMNLKDNRATERVYFYYKIHEKRKESLFQQLLCSKHSQQRIGQFAVLYKLDNQAVIFRIKSHASRQ